MSFWCFHFLQKTNENKSTSSKDEFFGSFFGRNVGSKKSIQICLTFSLIVTLQHSAQIDKKEKKNVLQTFNFEIVTLCRPKCVCCACICANDRDSSSQDLYPMTYSIRTAEVQSSVSVLPSCSRGKHFHADVNKVQLFSMCLESRVERTHYSLCY